MCRALDKEISQGAFTNNRWAFKRIALGMLSSLEAMHNEGYVHMDIKVCSAYAMMLQPPHTCQWCSPTDVAAQQSPCALMRSSCFQYTPNCAGSP
jgi:hypothetical protein